MNMKKLLLIKKNGESYDVYLATRKYDTME